MLSDERVEQLAKGGISLTPELAREVVRLRAEIARLKPDAEIGAAVRGLPAFSAVHHDDPESDTPWQLVIASQHDGGWCETLEAALAAAGLMEEADSDA